MHKKLTRSGPENITVVKMLHVVFVRIIVEPLELTFAGQLLQACAKSTSPMDPSFSKLLTAFFAIADG